jgi:hypothetical protein
VVRYVGKFGRLGRSKIFRGQLCREVCEVRVVRKFGVLAGQEICEVGSFGRAEGSSGHSLR